MILVDELRQYIGGPPVSDVWCHMMTDDLTDAGLEELHAIAAAIGLRREWFQNKPNLPHYDLTPWSREEALFLGAQPVTSRELVRRCYRGNRYRKGDTPAQMVREIDAGEEGVVDGWAQA